MLQVFGNGTYMPRVPFNNAVCHYFCKKFILQGNPGAAGESGDSGASGKKVSKLSSQLSFKVLCAVRLTYFGITQVFISRVQMVTAVVLVPQDAMA